MSGTTESCLNAIRSVTIRDGFSFIPEWCPDVGTLELAKMAGPVVDIASMLPTSNIPTVQTLVPRGTAVARPNVYSHRYGLGEFPVHTDLAHWPRPPRYFLLRCKSTGSTVTTNLLSIDHVLALAAKHVLERAVFRARHSEVFCPLPFLLPAEPVRGLRWDPIFILPMNAPARELAGQISEQKWRGASMTRRILSAPGDTLLVDNWRVLHGRGPVHETQTHRTLERVYLSGLHS
jgi:L-asparagine oxygenase